MPIAGEKMSKQEEQKQDVLVMAKFFNVYGVIIEVVIEWRLNGNMYMWFPTLLQRNLLDTRCDSKKPNKPIKSKKQVHG